MVSGTSVPNLKTGRAPLPESPNRTRLILACCAAAVVVGLAIWWIVHWMGPAEPRLNEPTAVLAKFVSTSAFESLPYEKQRPFYKMLDDRGGKEIEAAFKNGKITEGEYRTALDAAWLGKHIGHMEKYVSLAPGNARGQYVDQLVAKKLKKDAEQAKGQPKAPDDEIDADQAAAEMRVEAWPANIREQWNLFHNAYRKEKKAREEATTRPSPR